MEVQKITAALGVIAKDEKTPDIWAGRITVVLYKSKGGALECTMED